MSEPAESVRPERLAAAARALQRALLELVALRADQMADSLATELGMVPWDREQLLGRVQRELKRLRERRFSGLGGPPVRVVERREQPLECIAAAWAQLRRGRRVAVEAEPGATRAGLDLLAEIAQTLGERWLFVVPADGSSRPDSEEVGHWELCGVEPAHPRVALVQEDADPELAAYVLARACLRRTGFDPRGVHHAVVTGSHVALVRHLRRLWVGARMGSARDHSAFAGPVDEAQARSFEDTLARLSADERVDTLVQGDRLELPGAGGVCLAPALFLLAGAPADFGPLTGPTLIVHPCAAGDASALLDRLGPRHHGRIFVGDAPRGWAPAGGDRRYDGALLLERIPPGLPKPRP